MSVSYLQNLMQTQTGNTMTNMIKVNCQMQNCRVFEGAVKAYREADEETYLQDSL